MRTLTKAGINITMNFLKYLAFIFFLTNLCFAQVYLGLIEKEGIFLDENFNENNNNYEYRQEQLKRITFDSYNSIVYDNYQKDFDVFTRIKKGDKFYISCSNSIVEESVSGYIIYDWSGITKEFYPLVSNKSNKCSYNEDKYNYNIVIISKTPINKTIS